MLLLFLFARVLGGNMVNLLLFCITSALCHLAHCALRIKLCPYRFLSFHSELLDKVRASYWHREDPIRSLSVSACPKGQIHVHPLCHDLSRIRLQFCNLDLWPWPPEWKRIWIHFPATASATLELDIKMFLMERWRSEILCGIWKIRNVFFFFFEDERGIYCADSCLFNQTTTYGGSWVLLRE